MMESLERAFGGYGEPLEDVTTFRYLVRVLTVGDDDWLAVVDNLGKAQKSWGRLSLILIQEGEYPKVLGSFNKAVAQAVLLFGAYTWVLTPRMERSLYIFQHRVAQGITGRQPRRRGGGSWEYPPLYEAIGEAGFEGIIKSVTKRHNMVAQYIATQPILDLCERATHRPGVRVFRRWWEQAGINLEGGKEEGGRGRNVLGVRVDSESNADPGGQ